MYVHFSYVSTCKYLLVNNKFSKKNFNFLGWVAGKEGGTFFRGGVTGEEWVTFFREGVAVFT